MESRASLMLVKLPNTWMWESATTTRVRVAFSIAYLKENKVLRESVPARNPCRRHNFDYFPGVFMLQQKSIFCENQPLLEPRDGDIILIILRVCLCSNKNQKIAKISLC